MRPSHPNSRSAESAAPKYDRRRMHTLGSLESVKVGTRSRLASLIATSPGLNVRKSCYYQCVNDQHPANLSERQDQTALTRVDRAGFGFHTRVPSLPHPSHCLDVNATGFAGPACVRTVHLLYIMDYTSKVGQRERSELRARALLSGVLRFRALPSQ